MTRTDSRFVRIAWTALVASVGIASNGGCSLGLDDIGPVVPDGVAGDGAPLNAAKGGLDAAEDGVAATGTADDALGPDVAPATLVDAAVDTSIVGLDQDGGVADASTAPAPESGIQGDAARCARDIDCPQEFGKCVASVCRDGTCSASTSYGLLSSQFTVAGVPVNVNSAGSQPPRAIAAAYPYVFVATTMGVSAFDLTSPVTSAPRAVRIDGLTLPSPIVATVAVGSTVYFVTAVSGISSGAYQAVGWIDVSADASFTGGVASLQAHVAPALPITPPLNETPTNIDSLYNVLPNGAGGLFLIYYSSDHPTYYPTVSTTRPSASDTLIPYWNLALVTGAQLGVSSGSRLIAYANDSQQPKFAVVTGPGTSAASVGSQITVPTPSALKGAFGSDADGGVLWTSARVSPPSARVTLLVANSAGSLAAIPVVAPGTYIDIESYTALPTATSVVAPPVWVDGTGLALGFASDHADLSRTDAHVISVSAGTLTHATGIVSLPSAASTLAVASSHAFAYALSGGATSSTVYVLAPSCAK